MKNILDFHPAFQATIGIEVHVQLNTITKIFCSCPNRFGDVPNKNICPICVGHPGTLPVLNKKVVDSAILVGLATHCEIEKVSSFARKHYLYPDLPKNYQITQGSKPICKDGYIPIDLHDRTEKRIRIMRIHMEEDAGKTIHEHPENSLIDLNRAGTPLLEIVSQPDIEDTAQAKAYLMRLRALISYLGVSDVNMEEGSFRADVNISVKRKDADKLGTRAEMKNINSFKFIGQAIDYEIKRQIELILNGQTVKQETRLWDTKKHKSVAMRSKEKAQDYRYFTDPDLPLIVVDSSWIERIRKKIPELPHQKYHRFQEQYDLSSYEANILINKAVISEFFEKTVQICQNAKAVSNLILRDVLSYLKEHKIKLKDCKVTPETLAELVGLLDQNVINSKVGQDVFAQMADTGKYPSVIIDEKDLKQIDSSEELEVIVKRIITDNPNVVVDYKCGNQRVFAFFIGQAMKATNGKADPKLLQELFRKLLK